MVSSPDSVVGERLPPASTAPIGPCPLPSVLENVSPYRRKKAPGTVCGRFQRLFDGFSCIVGGVFMKETTNYKLGLWDVQDEVGREGFNGNFTALDAALKGEAEARVAGLSEKAQVVVGTYTGDGAASQVIQLGFTPKAVLVMPADGQISTGSSMQGGIALPDSPAYYTSGNGNGPIAALTEGGFQVYEQRISSSYYIEANNEGKPYHYWAVR